MLAIARASAEPVRGVALAGAVRLATNVAAGRDKTPLDALALLTQANALVASEPERMMVVSALGNVRRVEALRLLEPYLAIDAVKTEAALAIVQIAPALLNGANAAAVNVSWSRLPSPSATPMFVREQRSCSRAARQRKKAGKKKQ